jgi:hypothetical protein
MFLASASLVAPSLVPLMRSTVLLTVPQPESVASRNATAMAARPQRFIPGLPLMAGDLTHLALAAKEAINPAKSPQIAANGLANAGEMRAK